MIEIVLYELHFLKTIAKISHYFVKQIKTKFREKARTFAQEIRNFQRKKIFFVNNGFFMRNDLPFSLETLPSTQCKDVNARVSNRYFCNYCAKIFSRFD